MVYPVLQNRYTCLISGIVICVAGLSVLAYLSPEDFLEPGFVTDGIIIQDQYISPKESIESFLYLTKEGQSMTISVLNPMSEVPLRLELKDPDGMTIKQIDSSKPLKLTFRTENVGKYTVTITNIGTQVTKITIPYGHSISEAGEPEINKVLGVVWILLVFTGSYLILHTDLKVVTRERK